MPRLHSAHLKGRKLGSEPGTEGDEYVNTTFVVIAVT